MNGQKSISFPSSDIFLEREFPATDRLIESRFITIASHSKSAMAQADRRNERASVDLRRFTRGFIKGEDILMRLLDASIVYRHVGRADAAKLLEDPTGKSLALLEESSRRDPEERKILLEKVVTWRKNCKMLVAVANNAADQHILSLLKWLDLTSQALSGEARRLLDEQIKRGEYEHVVSYLERIETAVDVLNTSPLRSSRLGRATIIWTPGGVAKSLAASRAVEYRKATPDWKNFYIAAAGVAGFTVGLTFGLECPISKEDAIDLAVSSAYFGHCLAKDRCASLRLESSFGVCATGGVGLGFGFGVGVLLGSFQFSPSDAFMAAIVDISKDYLEQYRQDLELKNDKASSKLRKLYKDLEKIRDLAFWLECELLSTNQIADEMRHHMSDIRGILANRRISNAIKQVHICDQIDGLMERVAQYREEIEPTLG